MGTTRITIEPGKRGGKPCIRGLRITVWDVLGWLGAGFQTWRKLGRHVVKGAKGIAILAPCVYGKKNRA